MITEPHVDVAREAYERHMRRMTQGIPSPTRMWKLTALSTGALRPADLEDVRLFRAPPSKLVKRAVLDKDGTLGPAEPLSDIVFCSLSQADLAQLFAEASA